MRLVGTLILACVPALLTLGTTGCGKKKQEVAKPADGGNAEGGNADNAKGDEARRKEEKPVSANEARIRGTWEVEKGEMPAGSTLEFNPNLTLKVTPKDKEKGKAREGTYKVEGSKLTMTYKPEGEETTLTIKQIGYRDMSLEDAKGKPIQLKRTKWLQPTD